MKTIKDIIDLSSNYLKERNLEKPRRFAEELIGHILKMRRIDLYMHFDKPVVESELEVLRSYLKRAVKGEPLEYILGEVEFYGCTFKIDSRVLIPRPETELLVDMIAKKINKGTVWDVCAGSGCIGISLKKKNPDLKVTLSDISKDALMLAKENAEKNNVEVFFKQGDLLEPFKEERADVIISNPPYISQRQYLDLDRSVIDFEPKIALVAGSIGTEFYQRFSQSVFEYLNPGGSLFFEIGYDQEEAIKEIFSGRGEVLKDLSGHPRFFFLENLR